MPPRPQAHLQQPSAAVFGSGAISSPVCTVSNVSDVCEQAHTQTHDSDTRVGHDFYLKVFTSANKKDWRAYTVRNITREIDTPVKLKEIITEQCGKDFSPEDVGYLVSSTKHWFHNRLDISEMWDKVESGTKITLWCTCATTEVHDLGGKRRRNMTGPMKRALNAAIVNGQNRRVLLTAWIFN